MKVYNFVQKLGDTPQTLGVNLDTEPSSSFRGCHAILLMVDSTDKDYLSNTLGSLADLNRSAPEGTPIFIIAETGVDFKTSLDDYAVKIFDPSQSEKIKSLFSDIVKTVQQNRTENQAASAAAAMQPSNTPTNSPPDIGRTIGRIKNALIVRNPESKGIKEMKKILDNNDLSPIKKIEKIKEMAIVRLEKSHMVSKKDGQKSSSGFFNKVKDKFTKERDPDNQALYEVLKDLDIHHPNWARLDELAKVAHDYSQDQKKPGYSR